MSNEKTKGILKKSLSSMIQERLIRREMSKKYSAADGRSGGTATVSSVFRVGTINPKNLYKRIGSLSLKMRLIMALKCQFSAENGGFWRERRFHCRFFSVLQVDTFNSKNFFKN